MPEALALIEAAADRGVRIGFDCYPYTAGSTYLSAYLPAWVTAGDWTATAARLRDPDLRRRLAEELGHSLHPDFSRIRIAGVATEASRDLVGLGVTEAAAERGQDLADFLAELLLAEDNRVMAIYFSMGDADLELALVHPLGALGTDSLAVGPAPHPRCYGSAPRLLGRYVRERGLLRLEEAIRKLTSLPAERLGLADRGRLAPGCAADVVVFDPATILDTATYENPRQFPVGIEYVLVNGEIAVEKGKLTGIRAGQVV
jgi:N-acyl-D-aspartate/D-glutamate deacylase